MTMRTQNCDALILGGGGAGLRAALQLGSKGHDVIVLSKVFPTRSHTVAAQGGVNAALGNTDGEDDWRWHMYDTVMGSDFLGDQDAIEYMCEQAPSAIIELEHLGLPFSRDAAGKIYQRAFGGQTREYGKSLVHRTCCAADRTGHAMLHTLYQQCVGAGVCFYNEWYGLDLVKARDGSIAGIIALCMETGEVVYFKSRATVLATGGGWAYFSIDDQCLYLYRGWFRHGLACWTAFARYGNVAVPSNWYCRRRCVDYRGLSWRRGVFIKR